ncbi:UvrD-helicase domain-containing protein [Desulfobacca acetoxidans]|uniref:DNA 3'-5' helicase n=1 Tax=Desulfobacca acetoxidans (strain ATCC 700848 / DSM 11109 / ASRB2) TaxID=880072 RepID=F2NEC6_DESAR|nr:UvrD-helicase domain-containing protein [Desulfobacca acetoxidans]AEB08116.1 UvrD/REP helicase [Desulfobacca acetoxidans DSM 11109]
MTAMAPVDQRDRELAVNPSYSVHVEAPAGSGKTTVLLKRYLTLLARVEEPEEVLALTFTRKAAGELRARIQQQLQGGTEQPSDVAPSQHAVELRELAQTVSHQQADKKNGYFERLQISTFHSFCAQLLRLAPHNANLPPDFQLIEDREADWLKKEAIELMRRRLATLPASDPVRQTLVRRLVRLNNDWPRLAAELRELLSRREVLGDFIALARESRDPEAYKAILLNHLIEIWQPELDHLQKEFLGCELGRNWSAFYRYLADAGAGLADDLPESIPEAQVSALPDWGKIARGLLTKEGSCYRTFPARSGFPKKMRESVWGGLLQNLPETLVPQLRRLKEQPSILLQPDEVPAVQDLIILLNQALTAYEELCQTRRVLDFSALEQAALNLLSDKNIPDLLWRLDRRLSHLLVDEFQDTSARQMELLCRLLTGWSGDLGRSLMVVGDPKQSIYGWRQARVELFFQTRRQKRLPCPEAPPFTTLTLSTNFRSTSTLIQWVNNVFGQTIMKAGERNGVEFSEAVAKPDAKQGDPPQLALFTAADRSLGRKQEANWLARQVSLKVKNIAAGESIGILLFTRRQLPAYLLACQNAGLSLRVREGLALYDSLAVQHLHNAVTALVHPHDDIAWAGLLQGFAGPQPLGFLAQVADYQEEFWSKKLEACAVSNDCPAEVRQWWRVCAEAGKMVGRAPLHEILAEWLSTAGGWERIAAWEGAAGVANARVYLDLLATAASCTPEATLARLTDLLTQAFQPADPRAKDSPVEVLTVHAAKGLEFDHVFLPSGDWQPLLTGKSDTPFLMEETSSAGGAVIALNCAYAGKEQSLLYHTLRDLAKQRLLSEARRLFYVAVTRAKKSLQISGVIKTDKAGNCQFPANSPLGWLRQHYPDGELYPGQKSIWQPPPLPVSVFQEISELLLPTGETKTPPLPYDLQPELLPYKMQFPSQLSGSEANNDSDQSNRFTSDEDTAGEEITLARLRGEIIHRLLETLSRGVPLPEPAAVASVLRSAGVSAEYALDLADEMLAEVKACRDDPFLAPLLDANLPVVRSEWLVEAWQDSATIRRGRLDRLVFDGYQWWLLDYKTSRPPVGIDWETFLASETDAYRPQLLAYRELAARFFQLASPEMIQPVLYFTANRRHIFL